jgi:hypothetical protein
MSNFKGQVVVIVTEDGHFVSGVVPPGIQLGDSVVTFDAEGPHQPVPALGPPEPIADAIAWVKTRQDEGFIFQRTG